ncbi:MAG: RNA methyltransferase [Dysgonamonadaceae bacterium]|nr:RNA methyltransferase [Dysgonamonadaceae bacterium]
MERITSLQNDKIKNIRLLNAKARERKDQALFIIEGVRELNLAINGGYRIDSVYLCLELMDKTSCTEIVRCIAPCNRFEISKNIFQKLAYREDSGGILALAKPQPHTLADLNISKNPFIIVIEAVEKPGNLGGILRTADAAHIDAVIVCDQATDIYNPNVIRSSVGCLFTVPVVVSSNSEAYSFLKERNIQTFAAELTAAQWYQAMDYTQPSAIVMGSEANGLTDFWLRHADYRIKIPMRGAIDSLNVSVSTAIITFEAMRQRLFK